MGISRALITGEGQIFLLLRTRKAEELGRDLDLSDQPVRVTGQYVPGAKVLIVQDCGPAIGRATGEERR